MAKTLLTDTLDVISNGYYHDYDADTEMIGGNMTVPLPYCPSSYLSPVGQVSILSLEVRTMPDQPLTGHCPSLSTLIIELTGGWHTNEGNLWSVIGQIAALGAFTRSECSPISYPITAFNTSLCFTAH